MEHRQLGRTGVSVSKLCLGAMMFGAWGNPNHDESIRIIHAALDAGINFVDTADVYGQGESEEIVGKALAGGRRDDVVLATKVFSPMGDDVNRRGMSRRWIMRAVEDSLRRLATDWIDLYQIHRLDPATDIEDTLGALTDLVQQGKVRYIGASTVPAPAIVEAQWAGRDRRLQRFVTEQPPYSILVRGIEGEVLPTCAKYGMGVMTYSPLAGGWLSGRWRKGSDQPGSTRAARLPERFDLSLPANQQQARRHRAARTARRRRGHTAHPDRDRVRPHPPRRHRGDHRTAHDGTSRKPAPRRGHRPRRGAARPHRRDRRAGHQPQPRRCR
jgi:aryl-alcohol dehydrogenase-like predicted oxidoreductase